jgi:alkanesulfonate monooxygenase SsuD/methylene tetrahydromethanopterin reductase-like flavin-dependent oxidoreductase (luciferase family)
VVSGGPHESTRHGTAPTPPAAAELGVLVGARTDGDPDEAERLARLADSLGYREIMVAEGTGHDAFALAAALGRGPAALCLGPLPAAVRDPVTVARGAASVAALTGRSIGVALAASTSAVVEEWHGRTRGVPATVVAESASALRGPRPPNCSTRSPLSAPSPPCAPP